MIQRLRIRQFRNIAAAELEFGSGANVFVGENGQGKTNVLEAIRYAATATSHRTWQDQELVQWNQGGAHLRLTVRNNDQDTVLDCGFESRKRLFKIDGDPLPRLSALYGIARTVLFTPEDLQIVAGDPRGRRRFIDLAIAQVKPAHVDELQKMRRALSQRNALLKHLDGNTSRADELDPWDDALAGVAALVALTRESYIHALSEGLGSTHHVISGEREKVRLRYRSDCLPSEDDPVQSGERESLFRQEILQNLIASRDRDLRHGHTSKGPHRDDLAFMMDDRDLGRYGSQGQRRTAVLSARLGEAAMIENETGERPALLIDDVIYEMDEGRRQRFLEHVCRGGQSFATCTDVEHLGPLADESNARIFHVKSGRVTE